MTSPERNAYLDQVISQQSQLEQDLRVKKAAAPARGGGGGDDTSGRARRAAADAAMTPPTAVDVRVTGVGPWKTVLVPPNAFVVHTRRGHAQPLHLGLGVSFRYRSRTDSYLVVPGTMQTILLNAFCICRELQGVLVQAYVQWIVQDIATAYRKLDFGDASDPMRLVNLQLKEQAEAAIKDKVATMSVHEVLSDKQPIIEELTARLRGVAEGADDSDHGLGLRIVTVQIKEAVVTSARLWENLQKPFRSEQSQLARLAELGAQEIVTGRELAADRLDQLQRLENDRELTDLRARNAAAAFDRDAAEKLRRGEREQTDARALATQTTETTLHSLRLEQQRHELEAEAGRLRLELEHALQRLKLDHELTVAQARADTAHATALLELERDRVSREIANDRSPAAIQAELIANLPQIVSKLPKPDELRTVNLSGTDSTSLAGIVTELTAAITAIRAAVAPRE
ncbi:SPFH domain-containing protein [Catellatospora sp. KI3]|uniref:SPFH domain-containing protein n=1 Tax=Catellatospora sp. KI3 TaxID=3041620 RepID=UPI0024821D84|nr:SPFH domain-containing protein [Catellatospora sp. KI3]MDI1459988.1 SPFH domain-containing protein [Catellatospora sp. KI3]